MHEDGSEEVFIKCFMKMQALCGYAKLTAME